MKKEKLNKKDTEKVSGGYIVYSEGGRRKDANGKTYDVFCDACGKQIVGSCSFKFNEIKGEKIFCLDCALKIQQLLSQDN
ncbi:MAG: hypothetical protein IJI84_05905 [Clostridia bacterium]|nr:hypothetical protein [Clostridia bacterium]